MFVSQALQILLMSLAVAAFLVVLGALAVGPDVRDAWGVAREDVILRLGLFGEEIEVTRGDGRQLQRTREYLQLRSARQPSAAAPAATGD